MFKVIDIWKAYKCIHELLCAISVSLQLFLLSPLHKYSPYDNDLFCSLKYLYLNVHKFLNVHKYSVYINDFIDSVSIPVTRCVLTSSLIYFFQLQGDSHCLQVSAVEKPATASHCTHSEVQA